jgi:hypothetical protein
MVGAVSTASPRRTLRIEITLTAGVRLLGLLISSALGDVAGLLSARRASRQEITASLRAV